MPPINIPKINFRVAFPLAVLGLITFASWAYLLTLSDGMAHSPPPFLTVFVMWSVMMVAMMTPSALPFAILATRSYDRPGQVVLFFFGYLAVWTGFGALASIAQLQLRSMELLSPAMASNNATLSAIILLGAGIYQLLPLKQTCLAHCRSPVMFFLSHWRDGLGGAFRMGFSHGMFCLGCCAMIMAVLFVVGVMNLLWVGLITFYVIAEKYMFVGNWPHRLVGVVLICSGLFLLSA